MKQILAIAFTLFVVALAGPGFAQGTRVAFGGFSQDPTLPVEITADKLEINQADGTATFRGNVVIGQGQMRLSAAMARVEYKTGGDVTGEIRRMVLSGGVTLVNGAEAAESESAVYTIDDGQIVLSGGVILTQGRNALSADRLIVNLTTGTGLMEGRVKTILQPENN